MDSNDFLIHAVVYLGTAVVAVPLCKRLGLGAVLGYLAGGALIGPWALGLIGNVQSMLQFSQLGVVLLLFVIGLELSPRRLWVLRRSVFGLGGVQVLVTAAVFFAAGRLLGLSAGASAIAGFGFALSSTAFALQLLAEKRQLSTGYGRAAFAILLFQDLAVIPVLALLPLLGGHRAAEGLSWLALLRTLGVIVLVVAGGRLLLRPALRLIALARSQEVFSATTLLIAGGTALLMHLAGLSMGLGAFLAGVLLADSEYRHELEANIEPFKGLLLGLFFIAVGMSVNFGLLIQRPLTVLGLVVGLLAAKYAVIGSLGRWSGMDRKSARKLAAVIAQGGEFAFVVFSVASGAGLLTRALSDLLVLVVTLSMAATPLLVALNERLLSAEDSAPRDFDAIQDDGSRVIIAGFGRFGQVVARILRAQRMCFTALEINPEQVDFVRKYGSKIYYGDASRLDLLRAAGTEKAKLFVLAIDDPETSLRTARVVHRHFPNVRILARARNREHAFHLLDLGIEVVIRETLYSSLKLSEHVLQALGLSPEESLRRVQTFREYDAQLLLAQQQIHHDEYKLIASAQRAAQELEALFEADAQSEPAAVAAPAAD